MLSIEGSIVMPATGICWAKQTFTHLVLDSSRASCLTVMMDYGRCLGLFDRLYESFAFCSRGLPLCDDLSLSLVPAAAPILNAAWTLDPLNFIVLRSV